MQTAATASDASRAVNGRPWMRASSHNRVRQIGQLFGPHRIGEVIAVARELHLRLDARETWCITALALEQRSRRLREDAGVGEYIDDGAQRHGGFLRCGALARCQGQTGSSTVRASRRRPIDRLKIRAGHWIAGRTGVVPEPNLPRHLEKCAGLRGGREPLPLPASFTVESKIEHGLFFVGEQVVQAIDLGCGVRKAPAPAHQTMEIGLMLGVE